MPAAERLLGAARGAKHAAYLARRAGARSARTAAYRAWDRVLPYRWSPERYPDSFLTRSVTPAAVPGPVPRVIHLCWTGDNAMSANRRRGLESVRAHNPQVEVRLVTPETLADVVVPDAPLHPAYEQLSFVHRSDYLRCYLMHHHGGGYSDVKRTSGSWSPLFDRLDAAPQHWALGYPEVAFDACADLPGRLGRDLKVHHASLIGNAAFIMRPHSPLTAEWLGEVHRRLDRHLDALIRHPGNAFGTNPGYPVFWTELQSEVLQPLVLKHANHVIRDRRILPDLHDHR